MSVPEATDPAISNWRPHGVSFESAAFARKVVGACSPAHPQRARSLLWASSRLCEFGSEIGLAAEAKVLLRPSVIERFVSNGATPEKGRRTLRADLRFLGRRVVPELFPPDPLPIPRGRSKTPYSEAEIASYLALADAQKTEGRRLRSGALVALGAGAGLVGADLRFLCGSDVSVVEDRVVVSVPGRRARTVLVDMPYDRRVLSAAHFAGERFLIGGVAGARHNVTGTLISKLSGGEDLPRLDVARLRASWLAKKLTAFRLPELLAAAGITSSKHLFDLLAQLPSPGPEAVCDALARAGAGAPF
jgi:hypothetical protein